MLFCTVYFLRYVMYVLLVFFRNNYLLFSHRNRSLWVDIRYLWSSHAIYRLVFKKFSLFSTFSFLHSYVWCNGLLDTDSIILFFAAAFRPTAQFQINRKILDDNSLSKTRNTIFVTNKT